VQQFAEQAREAAQLVAQVATLPQRDVDSITKVLSMGRRNSRLTAANLLQDAQGQVRIQAPDAPGVVQLTVFPVSLPAPDPALAPPDPEFASSFSLLQSQFLPQRGTVQTSVSQAAGRITVARGEENDATVLSVQLIQDPYVPNPDPQQPPLRLY